MRIDLHVHSKYSFDGWMDPKDMVNVAIKKGLSGIAVTDHNTIRGGLKTKKYETENFKIIVGSEINTERGEVIGLFLSEEIISRSFLDVLDEIKAQNGRVIIPHPFDDLRGNGIYPSKEDVKLLDCVEVFNSRCLRREYNDKAQQFAIYHGLNLSAGSDAHFANEIGKAGIIVHDYELRDIMEKRKIKIFGERSNFINLGLTKVLKTWRKAIYG